jgi:hypothetical protein
MIFLKIKDLEFKMNKLDSLQKFKFNKILIIKDKISLI